MNSPGSKHPRSALVKTAVLRIVLGIGASVAVMAAVFYFLLFPNPLGIHDANILRWVPVLAAFCGTYVGGFINRETPLGYLPALGLSFVIFDLFNYLYLPFAAVLALVGVLAAASSRRGVSRMLQAGSLLAVGCIFAFTMLAQPLIIEHEGFGRNADGEWVNATVLWDFSGEQPPGFPAHVLLDDRGASVDISSLNGSTVFVSYWATWCIPCIRDMPRLDQIKADFADDASIRFVDISLDEDREAWSTFLTRRIMPGKQLIAQSPDETRRVLEVSALPSHLVMEADGSSTVFESLGDAEAMLRGLDGI